MITAVLVFLSVAALDFVWAHYTKAVNRSNPMMAGIYAAIIMLLGGTAAVGYVNDPWMLIPACLGAFVGTYGALK
jgi:hypothetical protein